MSWRLSPKWSNSYCRNPQRSSAVQFLLFLDVHGAHSQAPPLPRSLLCGQGDTHPVRCETRRGRIAVSRENAFGCEHLPVRARNKLQHMPVHSEPVIWQMWDSRRENTQQKSGGAHLKDQFVQLCALRPWVLLLMGWPCCKEQQSTAEGKSSLAAFSLSGCWQDVCPQEWAWRDASLAEGLAAM